MKAAVVGVGYLGRFHAEKYAKSKKAELVAVVDTDEKSGRECARRYKAKVLENYRELPDCGVQCASIVTPTSTHCEIASWLLENGIDVLIEKPMAASTAEAKRLIEAANANDRMLQVGHLERFNPAFRVMERFLNRPMFFEVRRIAKFKGRGHDVDVVLDLMIHDIDIVAHLVGRPLTRVEAVGVPVLTDSVDIANARLTFEGGAVANFTASRAAFKSERSVRIFQRDTYVSLDYEKKKLKIYNKTGAVDSNGFPKISITEEKVTERDALEHEIDSFIETVLNRGVPEVTGNDGLRALELTDRIHQAFRESLQRMDADQHFEEMERAVNS